MSNHLPDLGWVDFIVCHSTVCLAELAEELGGTSKSKSSPTQVREVMVDRGGAVNFDETVS